MRRRRNKKTAVRAGVICLSSIILFIVTMLLNRAFDKTEPILLTLSENQFKNIITTTVYSVAEGIDLTGIVHPSYDSENRISSLSTDTSAVNRVSAEIVNALEEAVGDKDINIKIPIGDVIGDSLSLGQGPNIILQINQYKSTNAEIISSFHSTGINQTLHTLTLELDVEAVVLLPGLNTEKITACLSLPLSETLIVGDTPSTYISRDQSYLQE